MNNHIHRYKKVNLSRDKAKPYLVYRCIKPGCTHYVRLDAAEGLMCECNICEDIMVITKITLRNSGGKPMTKPRCANCIKRKKASDVESIAEFLSEMDKKTGTEE